MYMHVWSAVNYSAKKRAGIHSMKDWEDYRFV